MKLHNTNRSFSRVAAKVVEELVGNAIRSRTGSCVPIEDIARGLGVRELTRNADAGGGVSYERPAALRFL